MYCKQGDEEAFSYGIIIKNVDVKKGTFEGAPRKAGKYKVKNGTLRYDEKTQRAFIAYDEVWGTMTDSLTARIKSNSKFQCESGSGYEQKATHERLNLPDDPKLRAGNKYYL